MADLVAGLQYLDAAGRLPAVYERVEDGVDLLRAIDIETRGERNRLIGELYRARYARLGATTRAAKLIAADLAHYATTVWPRYAGMTVCPHRAGELGWWFWHVLKTGRIAIGWRQLHVIIAKNLQ